MNTRINTRGRRRRNGAGSHAFRATRVEEIVMITSSDDPDVTIIPISPRSPEMSRFLRDIAPNWTKYSVNALRLEYAPLGGDDVAGRFSVGFVYDPTLPAPHNIAELVSSTTQKWRSYNAAFSEAAAVGQFKKDLYVNPDSESLHWTEAGYIVLISQDGPTADNGAKRGVLTVSYDITLMDYAPLEEFHPGQGFVHVTPGTQPSIATDENMLANSGYDITTYGDLGIVRALHPRDRRHGEFPLHPGRGRVQTLDRSTGRCGEYLYSWLRSDQRRARRVADLPGDGDIHRVSAGRTA
jgi:hypothetical protein